MKFKIKYEMNNLEKKMMYFGYLDNNCVGVGNTRDILIEKLKKYKEAIAQSTEEEIEL